MSNLADSISRVINPVARASRLLGIVAMTVMMLTVVADVSIRALFSIAIPGSIDIVGLTLIIVFFCAYASTEIKEEHIQVTVLVSRLPAKAQQIVTTNGYLVSIGIAIVICWQFTAKGLYLWSRHLTTGGLLIPEAPFSFLAAFFIGLFVLALVVNFLRNLDKLLTFGSREGSLWLLPGITVASGLLLFSLRPSLLALEIGPNTWVVIIFLLLFTLIFLKVHIGAAMALAGFLGMSYLTSVSASLSNLSISAIAVAGTYTWSVAPLFMWMGLLAYHGGFAKELYTTAYKWIGRLPGGLASATTAACAGLAALTGSSMTGVLTMGVIALPEMKKYKYDPKLATASICAASTIGSLIPPSLAFIVYGMITEVSIGKLFIAGIFPGIQLTVILMALITIMCLLNPKKGPQGPVTPWIEKLKSLKDIWAVVLLIVGVMGSLYMGLATPTEAAAVGAFGAIVISIARRRLSISGLTESMNRAVEMTGIIFFIFVFAMAFSRFITISNITTVIGEGIIGLGLAPYAIIISILFIYMILGCLMNSLPAVILTLPIFFPIVIASGFDPIWFGVMVVVMTELGQITPPIGMNVFAMAALQKDVPMYTIFRGVFPFWGAFIVQIAILIMFPQISLFLPSKM